MNLTLANILLLTATAISNAAAPPSSASYWLSQPVDHFGLNNTRWMQQYLVNATFYKQGGPVYVTTPGESPVSAFYTDSTHLSSLAQRTNGLVVAIEHRFYGKSNPMPDLSGPSLKYMTIENVLEDFASFVRVAKSNPSQVFPVPVSNNSRVVFVGASYAGNVAAWMRAKYTGLVSGAWASSAVVYGRLNNYQFDQNFGKHLEELGCGCRFSQAVKDLDDILLSNNATAVSDVQRKFGLPPLSARDFAGLVSGMATANANDPVTSASDPMQANICSYFTDDRSPLDSYAAVVVGAIKQQQLTPEILYVMGNTSLGINYYALDQIPRVWYYQECAWFGNWQVPPPSNSGLKAYRSQLLDLEYWQPNCQKKFGSGIKSPVDVDAYNQKWFDILKGRVRPMRRTIAWRAPATLTR
ncbi:hypothetical protein GQ54DRAFT_339191 [Martensiomyces pterosporus]|nr:hypothetical protein GQ54DRAFT_339191 [Martensiomyces pterosporus]